MRTWDESKHKRDALGRFACQDAVTPKMKKGGLFDGAGSEDEGVKEVESYSAPDQNIPVSIGAKWANQPIKMPDGSKAYFVEGTKITNIEVFAGYKCRRKIDTVGELVKRYPQSKERLWKKVKGNAYILFKKKVIYAELHWYEEPSVGRVQIKYKKRL